MDGAFALCMLLFCVNLLGADPIDFLLPPACFFSLLTCQRRINNPALRTRLVVVFCSFLLCYSISIVIGGAQASFVANFLLNIAFAVLVFRYVDAEARARRMVLLLTVSMFGSAAVAVCSLALNLPLLPNQFEIVRDNRFMSLFGDPNMLAAYSIFFVLFWFDELMFPSLFKSRNRAFVVVLLMLALLQLVLTLSRSAWLGLSVSLAIYLITGWKNLSNRNRTRIIVSLSLAAALAFAIISILGLDDTIIERTTTFGEKSSEAEEERFGFFYTLAALQVAAYNPLGVGPGMTSGAMGLVSLDGLPIAAHNAFVQPISDNGWVAGILFLSGLTWLTAQALRGAWAGRRLLGISERVVAAALVGMLVFGMFQDLLQWRLMWMVPALYVSMLASIQRPPTRLRE